MIGDDYGEKERLSPPPQKKKPPEVSLWRPPRRRISLDRCDIL